MPNIDKQINTHEKLLKKFGGNTLYEVLTMEGYVGSKDVFYKHFLDAITMTDRLISSSQSTEEPLKEISQEEYFDILVTEMNISLTCEELYKEYVKDMFKEKIKRIYSNNLEGLEEKATELVDEFLKLFNPEKRMETALLIGRLIAEVIVYNIR